MRLRHNFWMPIVYRDAEGAGGGGAGDGGQGGNGGGGTPWTSALPETIRGHEAWKDIPDLGTLATKYLDTRKPFADQLPEDIKTDASFRDIKNLEGLARSYHGQVKLLGVPKDQLLRVPTDDKPESWDPIWNRLGRPEKPDGYKLTVGEGEKVDDAFSQRLFAKAHALGVPQKALDGLYGEIRAVGKEMAAAAEAERTKQITTANEALKTEWGAAHGAKLQQAVTALEYLDKVTGSNGALKAALDATNLGNNPALAKAFAHLGGMFAEDGLVGKPGGQEGLNSPTEARQQIAALQQDKNFLAAYQNKSHAGHKDAVARMADLYAQAYPEQGRAA